jgi:ABC-type antimicrobial peptide transport system permease subunit
MVVSHSLALIMTGAVAGLIGAALLAGLLAPVLYGVGPFDGPSFGLAAFVLLLAGLLATLLPAVRATRVDPMVALREQ